MGSDIDHDIKVLNGLIETTLDSADGYSEAAKETDNTALRSLFEKRGSERRQVASELQTQVRALGGDPEDDGTVLAKAHRTFLSVKHAMLKDEQAVINSVENGEDFIKDKYEKALKDDDLTPATRSFISSTYPVIKDGHDQMRDIKHAMQGNS